MRLHSLTPRPTSQAHPSRTAGSKQSAHITENDVEAAIVHFLRQRGWLVERNQVGLLYTADGRPCPVGRRGQCDWRAIRPLPGFPGAVEHFEIEVKRPGAKPSKPQREYMAMRTHLGLLAVWADSLGSFMGWYEEAFGDGVAQQNQGLGREVSR